MDLFVCSSQDMISCHNFSKHDFFFQKIVYSEIVSQQKKFYLIQKQLKNQNEPQSRGINLKLKLNWMNKEELKCRNCLK